MQNNVKETSELSATERYSKNTNLLKIMLKYCSSNDVLSFSSSCSSFHEISLEEIANVFKEKCNSLITPDLISYSYIIFYI